VPGAALPAGDNVAVTKQFSSPYSARFTALQCAFEAPFADRALSTDALGVGDLSGCLGEEDVKEARDPARGLKVGGVLPDSQNLSKLSPGLLSFPFLLVCPEGLGFL
ncbi:uncharacterized protein METZ01_LOCUS93076, partial [marine metagenome]